MLKAQSEETLFICFVELFLFHFSSSKNKGHKTPNVENKLNTMKKKYTTIMRTLQQQ